MYVLNPILKKHTNALEKKNKDRQKETDLFMVT